MRNLSRVFFRCLSLSLIFIFLLPTFISVAHAQTPPPAAYQLASPNLDPDVPQNQHTFIQSLFLEMLLAVDCQLTGIDLTNPSKSCLGLDLKTGKLGYAPSDLSQQSSPQIGGLLGVATQGISSMYTPTFGSHEYFSYLSDNFGIVKQTHAAPYTGFQGLQPVLALWKTTRDISYYLLIVAFIFIGIGVMLRLKIDPRTVMTVQNQIPRVIICIILITFSYAFAGLMIDAMWTVTYMGINKLTDTAITNPLTVSNTEHLNQTATKDVLSTPFGFVMDTFQAPGGLNGLANIGWGVGQALGRVESSVIISLIFGNSSASCGWTNLQGCMQSVLGWIFGFLWMFIVAIALLISLFRIWFELLRAYIMVLIYVILAPIWIVFGLLPKRPLGFERWLRVFFANLAVFPATVLLIIGARILHELFNNSNVLGISTVRDTPAVLQAATQLQYHFVPPLVGNPAENSFGSILEFGVFLITPGILSTLREKLGVPPNKQVSQGLQTFSAARGAAGAPAKQTMKHLNKRDQYGNAVGPLAVASDRATKWTSHKVSKVPGLSLFSKSVDQKDWQAQHYGSIVGYDKAAQDYKTARNAEKAKGKGALKDFDDKHKGSVTNWAQATGWSQNNGAVNPPHIPPTGGAPTGGAPTGGAPTGGAPTGGAPTGGTPPTGQMPSGKLTINIKGPGGKEQSVTLQGRTDVVRDFVIPHLPDESTPEGQAARAEMRQHAADPESMFSKHLEDLTPEQATDVEHFVNKWNPSGSHGSETGGEASGGTE